MFRSTPAEPLNILSQVGLLLLMFQIGLEFDFSHLAERVHRRIVWAVAAAGLAAPFALGALLGARRCRASWRAPTTGSGFVLFVATAFSITAMPVLGRIMIEFKLTRTALGVIAISAAAINDVVGWLMLALVSALSVSAFAPGAFALRVAGLAALGIVGWWAAAAVAGGLRAQAASAPRNDDEQAGTLPATLMGVILACVFVAGMTTYQLGVFAIFGGFLIGVLLHGEHAFVTRLERARGPVHQRVLPADVLHLHRPAHRHRLAARCPGLGLVRAADRAGHGGQVRRLRAGGALGRHGHGAARASSAC